jgi:trehalose 6-phosphate phosphatase
LTAEVERADQDEDETRRPQQDRERPGGETLHVPESSRRSTPTLSRALVLAREALGAEPAGLLTDFDGTLSPIVSDPALARPVEGVSGALERLAAAGVLVAIITGRAPRDARAMLGAAGVLVVGNHGTEWLEPDATNPHTHLDVADVRRRLVAALARVPHLEGVPIEEKGLSASIHYRNAENPGMVRTIVLDALGDVGPEGLELRHGRMSVELRPMGAGDKGIAAREVIERHRLRGVLVMGDDVTDLDMFRAVAQLRDERQLRAAVIGVGGGDGEVPPEVAAAADVVLEGPEQAAELLDRLG